MIYIKKNQLFILVNEYQVIFLLAIIIDVFVNKGIAYSGFLLIYYFIVLLISIIKRKKFKISLINFLLPLFLTANVIFLADIWNEEMKKNTIEYYNSSKLTTGTEEKEITAFNLSRTARIYFENDQKFVSIYLFNFTKFIYDGKGNWEEIERD